MARVSEGTGVTLFCHPIGWRVCGFEVRPQYRPSPGEDYLNRGRLANEMTRIPSSRPVPTRRPYGRLWHILPVDARVYIHWYFDIFDIDLVLIAFHVEIHSGKLKTSFELAK